MQFQGFVKFQKTVENMLQIADMTWNQLNIYTFY